MPDVSFTSQGSLNALFGTSNLDYGFSSIQFYNGYIYGGYGAGGSGSNSNFLYKIDISNLTPQVNVTDDIRGLTTIVVNANGVYCYTPQISNNIRVYSHDFSTSTLINLTTAINGGTHLVALNANVLYMAYFDTPNYGIKKIISGTVSDYITPSPSNAITAMCIDNTTGLLYVINNNVALYSITPSGSPLGTTGTFSPPLETFIGSLTSTEIAFLNISSVRSVFIQYKNTIGGAYFMKDYSITSLQSFDDTITQFNGANNLSGLTLTNDGTMIVIQQGTASIIYISNTAFCFNKGTKILCLNPELVDEYIAIEQLQEGDFVKTYKHGYRKIIKTISGRLYNNPDKWNMCMYKMAKTETNGLLEDLIVTGGHAILVDSITKKQQAKYDEMGISCFSKQTIDGKKLLLSCVSEQFAPMPDTNMYTYYHLLLENNDDEEERFWIYANGILAETPNEKTLK